MSHLVLPIAIICTVIIAVPAPAQNAPRTVLGIKLCQTVKDDTLRLKCFDELAEKADAPAAPVADIARNWEVEQSRSPLDDSPQISASMLSTDGDGLIVLRCKENKTEVVFGKKLSLLGPDTIKVAIRINDGKFLETDWKMRQGVFAPNAIQFIQSLPDNGKLFLRALAFEGNSVEGEFKLGNVTEIRDKISAACNWPASAKKK